MMQHRGTTITEYECSRQFLLSLLTPRYYGEACIRDVSLQNARPEGHTERADWVLPVKRHVRALARSLDDSPTPIVEAASLDRSRRDCSLRLNALATPPLLIRLRLR